MQSSYLPIALLVLFLNPSFLLGQIPPGFVSVKAAPFLAKGDGVSDDTNAIQTALNSPNSIYVPAGVYLINNATGPMIVRNFNNSLTFAPTAVFMCSTANQGCVGFEGGNNPVFTGIHITYTTVPTDDCRVPNGMCSTLYFEGMTNATLASTKIDNGWAIGVSYINNISGSVTGTTINGTTRDGLFLQDNQNIQVSNLLVNNAGDDCLGFHDTTSGAGRHGATATNISCNNIAGGGIVVAGASNVTVSGFVINGTSAPGIYVISDPFLKPTNVTISSGVIRNVGSVPDKVSRTGTQHGIMVYGASDNIIGTLNFHDIQIANTNGSGVFGGGFVDSLALTNIDVENSGLDGAISNASCVSLTSMTSVTVNSLTAKNCYRAGLLAVTSQAISVNGMTVTNAWEKGAAEPGAAAFDFLANANITVNGAVIIDDQATPTGYVFCERLDGAGSVSHLTAQVMNGNFQVLNLSPTVSFH